MWGAHSAGALGWCSGGVGLIRAPAGGTFSRVKPTLTLVSVSVAVVLAGPGTAIGCVDTWGYQGGAPTGYPTSTPPSGHAVAIGGPHSTQASGATPSGSTASSPVSNSVGASPSAGGAASPPASQTAPVAHSLGATTGSVPSHSVSAQAASAALPAGRSLGARAAPARTVHPLRQHRVRPRQRSLANVSITLARAAATIETVGRERTKPATGPSLPGGWSLLVVLGLAVCTMLAQGLCRRRGGQESRAGTRDSLPALRRTSCLWQDAEDDQVEAELQQMLVDAQSGEFVTRGPTPSGRDAGGDPLRQPD
jgi:hypothetical protein